MDPQPSQQQAGLQHVVWWLQKEVTRPKARSKTYFGGGWGSNQVPTYLHLYPPRYRPGLLCASFFINVILEVVYIKFPFCVLFSLWKAFSFICQFLCDKLDYDFRSGWCLCLFIHSVILLFKNSNTLFLASFYLFSIHFIKTKRSKQAHNRAEKIPARTRIG